MRTMGLKETVHWLAWFITSFTQMTITMILLTVSVILFESFFSFVLMSVKLCAQVILRCGDVLTKWDPSVIFFVLELFAAATITFSYVMYTVYAYVPVSHANAPKLLLRKHCDAFSLV